MKLTSLLIVLLISSCGKKANEVDSVQRPKDISASHFSQNPIKLKSEKSKSLCSVNEFSDSQRNLNLSLFLRGEEVIEERYFSGLLDQLFVRDVGANIISQSYKGKSTVYKYVSTDDVVTMETEDLASSSPISICPDQINFEKGSLESAALNITYYISKASRKIIELLPTVKIPPVTVEVTPLIKKSISIIVKDQVVWSFEAFETDNAYYMPGHNSITFLPHSEEFRKEGMTASFWEIPMVSAHEYGHHVFETLHGSSSTGSGLKNCFGKFGMIKTETEGEKRTVSIDDILISLNEGFADLISFYTLENNERGLKGVPCLQTNRDVGSRNFADGSPKVFTSIRMSQIFAEKHIPGSENCDVPNMQNPHIVGAIFAHGVDRLLAISTDTKDQRLAIVLEWLNEMKKRSVNMLNQTPKEYLRDSFKLFVETTASKTDGKVDEAECVVAREIYPGIDGYLHDCRPLF